MYATRVQIVNNGPIGFLDFDFGIDSDGHPKTTVFVGTNGSGKSIVLSHLVNAILSARVELFDDAELDKGRVYKIRSPQYITHGNDYSESRVEFSNNMFVGEIQLAVRKDLFEEHFHYCPTSTYWRKVPDAESSLFDTNMHSLPQTGKDDIVKSTLLYFPANRFEEPAWLNEENLKNRANYTASSNSTRISNRKVINYSPLRENQNWLLDLIYDSFAIERRMLVVPDPNGPNGQRAIRIGTGKATTLLNSVSEFIATLLQREGPVTYSVGGRGNRSISVSIEGEVVVSNLFALSTGQSSLLNIFLSVLRDADLSRVEFNGVADISGILVIDEADLHLHSELQYSMLPRLIKLFPKVQFILTSHSPLFLMGARRVLGDSALDVVDLALGNRIDTERFSEFEKAYDYFKETQRFLDDLEEHAVNVSRPLVFLEGSTDIDYLRRAAEFAGRHDLLNEFIFRDGDGAGNLEKAVRFYDTRVGENLPQKILVIYDCDVSKNEKTVGNLFVRVLPKLHRKIQKGIENLFPDAAIERAMKSNRKFVDVTKEHVNLVRGVESVVPEQWRVNPAEKRNLCDWLCANATSDDFADFNRLFDFLEEVLAAKTPSEMP